MLNKSDAARLRELMKNNPEARELIQKLQDDHQMMISSISHEIRNPLTVVDGSMQLLEKSQPELTDSDLWRRTRMDVLQIARLLEDLSSYNNRQRMKATTFSMEDLLYDLADSFYYSLAESSQVEFTSDICENLPEYCGDRNKLYETILNLLVNAKDAVNGNGSICLGTIFSEDGIEITVKDDGCGIPPEHLSHIFEPFVTYKRHGTGLGLALAKDIVEAHDGSIHVDTSSDGTVFHIMLPMQAC
jgi:signal transduction histidine kinase